ncbi:prolactin receptor a isoform X2 [Corythoichthys intestinalis]|uniref:prolactin receptor a isoform X2 n=1 Tax=Corythoichthys intestinalis TaxID=161448 RepID=UPI0025A4E205|nr:prolactin receptor a isoform X2 [Corythoichthys intestinalis]
MVFSVVISITNTYLSMSVDVFCPSSTPVCGAAMTNALELTWLLFLVITPHAKGHSLPGKPTLTSCRSPEKETFTCWWQPGSDGGLPTTYALYYSKESSDIVHECADYYTAGENSCFFNKNDTSIWVNYNITVVATNRLGSTFSDPVDVDVAYIVQPNPPENLSLSIMDDKGWPFLRVAWAPPRKADTRSGWITLIYELRIQVDGQNEWETHLAGQQKLFNIFSLRSGGLYLVQVRCKPDHGFWSEWSTASYIRFPDYFHREKSAWIIIAVVCAFLFLSITLLLHMTCHSLKHCLLPPIPGPKIKGFDQHLLKKGKSEDIFSALVVSDFSRMSSSSNSEDPLVEEYLEVYVTEEREAMLEESKSHSGDDSFKLESSASDNDSGRGSCDSRTLLMEKCGRPKQHDGDRGEDWGEAQVDAVGGTWPPVFTSQSEQPRRCLSGCLPPSEASKYIKSRSDVNIAASGHKQSPARWSVEYVGTRMVAEDDVAVSRGCSQPAPFQERDYSRVKRVGSDDTLLLLQRVSEVATNECETRTSQKSTICTQDATLTSGYVDTAAILPMATN